MNEYKSDTANNADSRNTVQSVGNSWIVCRSKSHDGRIYYFNTLNGEAAWNLSDAEIEKAKKATKQLGNQPLPRTAKSPEPNENPLVNFGQSLQTPRNLIHMQPAQNLAFSGFVSNAANFSGSANNFVAIPNNLISTPMNTINVNNVPTVYNPHIWAIPPTQQIFISPPPLLNSAQASLDVSYNTSNLQHNLTGHNISTSVYNRFEVTNRLRNSPPSQNESNGKDNSDNFSQRENHRLENSSPRQNEFNPRSSTDNVNQRQNFKLKVTQRLGKIHIKQNDFYHGNNTGNFSHRQHDERKFRSNFIAKDLRQKLTMNRNFNYNTTSPSMSNVPNFFRNKLSSMFGPSPGDNETDGNEPKAQEQSFETTYRLDVTPLKELAGPNDNPGAWFIVVDADVILNEFRLLTKISDSDPQCHIMIPQDVMSELEYYVTNSQDLSARRILRYIMQEVRNGRVVIGEKNPNAEDDDTANVLLSTCSSLLEENFHFILLTNDSHVLNYKDSTNIKIFTPNELKSLLKPIQTRFQNTKTSTFIPKSSMKNVTPRKEDSDSIFSVRVDSKRKSAHKNTASTTNVVENESVPKLIKTVDAGIQTDFIKFTVINENTVDVEDTKLTKECEPVKPELKTNTVTNSDVQVKKRQIQLKRSTSSRPPTKPTQNNVIKTFKWRLKRNIASQSKEVNHNVDLHKANQTDPQLVTNLSKENPENLTFNVQCEDIATKETDSSISVPTRVMSPPSDISVPKRKVNENITIEETSTSGIISNSQSNNDATSESSGRAMKIQPPIDVQTIRSPIKNVMYDVGTPSMHEYLKTKCDEWVSRFLQIMEEVLSQVLHQDPPFTHSSLPPPWTLHEATQCISLKFNDQSDIKESAHKLSDILFKVSDHTGKIAIDMKPSAYMEMYSYGVSLVDSLKVVVKDSEDLHIATESLKKLLSDIQNPNLDCSAHESFNDVSHEEIIATDITSVEDNESQLYVTPEKLSHKSTPKSGESARRKYNLRSKKRLLIQDKEIPTQNYTSITAFDGDASFFSSLKLRRNDFMDSQNTNLDISNDVLPEDHQTDSARINVDKVSETGNAGPKKDSMNHMLNIKRTVENNTVNNTIECEFIPIKPTECLNNVDENDNNGQDTDVVTQNQNTSETTSGPKIIRNFGRCIEFEKKLKKKYEEERKMRYLMNSNIEEDLDYEEDYQYNTEEYGLEDEYDDSARHDNSEIVGSKSDEHILGEPKHIEADLDSASNCSNDNLRNNKTVGEDGQTEPEEPEPNNNNVLKFKFIIGKVLMKIKEAFSPVKILCEKYYEESMNPKGLRIKKIQLKAKAKKAHSYIANISSALESMMARELSNSNEDIKALFEKAGIDHIDESLRKEYCNTIAKCKSHAEVYLESLQSIISDLLD